jgi:integrase
VRVHFARDPDTGRQRQVSRIVRGGIKEARAKRAQLEVEVGQGKHGGSRATLGYLLDAWNRQREQEGASPTTLYEDRRKIDTVIRPALGDRELAKLGVRDLDQFYAGELAGDRSLATVRRFHAIIRSALNVGVDWGWLPSNPALRARVARQKGQRPELPVPTPDEVRRLIDVAAKSRNPELAGIFTVASLAGLRAGELCALRFSDLEGDRLSVRSSAWVRGRESGIKDPKSHQRRTLAVDELVVAVVAHRREIFDRVQALARTDEGDGFIWSPDGSGTAPLSPRALSSAFGRIAKRAGVKCRLHDLRRFMVTELVAAGFDVRTVADRAGHADPAFTARVYAAGREHRDEAAAELMGSLLAPALGDGSA